jgi:methylase of polypeptide subunit release factors
VPDPSSTSPPGLAARLRVALASASFTYSGVASALGPTAHAALSRNETLPGLRETRGGSPVETLTRLWLLQATVPARDVERALPGLLDPLCTAGMLERTVGEVRARVDVRPYATEDLDLWITSDLTPGLDGGPSAVSPDHVLGISSAATSLAQLTVREPVESALDLGTGCGVQSLHLAAHARRVVATDVNQRALRLTRFNAELNDVSNIDVREGSFFDPVAGEQFDLVATNPPFVISPATGERLVYRDSGLPGDRVVEDIVRGVPDLLREGGIAQVLANWMIVRDQPWQERLSSWIPSTGSAGAVCDAWVVQREIVDLPTYVELWLKDAGLHGSPDYHERYDTWLSWFEEQGAEAVGFGWINLRRVPGSTGQLRLEEWPYDVEQPIGPEVMGLFDRTARLRHLSDEDLGASRLVARADLRQESYGAPGAADPEEIVLRQQRWTRRARQVDTVEAALVGASDGQLTVLQILDAVADLLEQDAPDVRAAYLPVVRDLVAEGFLALEGS